MRPTSLLAILLSTTGVRAPPASGQAQEQRPSLEARVWLDRGEEPVLQRGDQVRVYYRTSQDAYAAIFRIDTDGVIEMVFPQHPGAVEVVRGGRDYRLLLPRTPAWSVDDDPGVGYFFMVASPEPLDFSAFTFDERSGWDLGAVGGVVYEDPYVAIDDYVAELVPDWEAVPYGLDFLTYHVGNTYAFPRFLCYDCHDSRPYATWNPYSAVCTSFRVVVWDDPYFYPSYRYSGTSVVVARPARALPRYELVTRGPDDIGVRPLVRSRAAPPRRTAQFKEAPDVPASSRVPVRRSTVRSATQVPRGTASPRAGQQAPEAAGRPTLQPRPSARLPVRTPPSGGARRVPQARATTDAPPREQPEPSARPDDAPPARQTEPTRAPTRRLPTRAMPTRAPTPATPQPSATARGSTGARAAPSARPIAPSRPSGGASSSRPTATARPAPTPSRPSARPSVPSTSRPSARPAPAPRAAAPRPSVQPRGRARAN